MKSVSAVLLLAGAASAHEAYGAPKPTAPPAYTTIVPCPSCPKSIAPKPITVTGQYQPVSTCSVGGYHQKPVCSTFPYVSTTIVGYGSAVQTITNHADYVTIDHTSSTITHYPTATPSTGFGYGYFPKNATKPAPPTYEEYEKTVKVHYDLLGPLAIPSYKGPFLWTGYYNKKTDETYQPVEIIERYGSKVSTYLVTYTQGKPTASATTFSSTGVYTLPASTVTVTKSTDIALPTTYHATKGDNTYGGVTTSCAGPTSFVYPVPTITSKDHKTYPTIIYKTITVTKGGVHTIVKPTHTKCNGPTDIVFPTAHPVPSGVYTHTKETITVTKPGQSYTCTYGQSSTYPVVTPSATPSASATPSPTDAYPTGPAEPNPSDVAPYPVEEYGQATAPATYVKRGGVIQRKREVVKKSGEKKRVILV